MTRQGFGASLVYVRAIIGITTQPGEFWHDPHGHTGHKVQVAS